MKILLVLLAVFAIALVSARNAEWESFKARFGRQYTNAKEEQHRFKVFQDNLRTIREHNQRFEKGEVTFTLGVTQFADLTEAEYRERLSGFKKAAKGKSNSVHNPSACTPPDSIDWRTQGYVTPVKDQGQCGSVVTFSVTGALEGANFAKSGTLVSLSEQNIQDCCPGFGRGCTGSTGTEDEAYQCVIDMGGIDSESAYTTGECAFPPGVPAGTCSSYVDIVSGSEDNLQSAVGCVGTVSADIDASHASFQLYVSGVYYEPLCDATQLDHSVLVVGYGSDAGNDYWIAKNSWGTSWGQKGYIDMARNQDNNCGIATQASYPIA